MDSRWRGNDERLGAMNRAPTQKPTLVRWGERPGHPSRDRENMVALTP